MNEVLLRVVSALLSAILLLWMTEKMMGALQQSGYQNKRFWSWLKRKDNMQSKRLWIFSIMLALVTAVTSMSFSFLGRKSALFISAIPYVIFFVLYIYADRKFALKVPLQRTDRVKRLYVGMFFLLACVAYAWIAILAFLSKLFNSYVYNLLAYTPVAILPMALPTLLTFVNSLLSLYEEKRNANFVKRAGQVLDEREIIRIGIVGSYGKTSVKNIVKTLLSERFDVVATPESYNTPIGIAKTVFSPEMEGKQIFIAEMGARKQGDIAELCSLVHPDYAIFTGVCEQHIQGFGSLQAVWQEKSVILNHAKQVVCGEGLQDWLPKDCANAVLPIAVKNVRLGATSTTFSLVIDGQEIPVRTKLLGNAGVENIRLAVTLCKMLGLRVEEIQRGVEKLQPIPHRLELLEKRGVFILDDGYNANPMGAKEALTALSRFSGRKCVVTPGLVECGILEKEINGELGRQIAELGLDKVILVGETLVGAVKEGYESAEGNMDALTTAKTLADAQVLLGKWIQRGDAVLFLNDLPDVY